MGRCQQIGSLVTISCVFKVYGLLAVGVIVGCQSSLISREDIDFEPVNPPAWLKNLPDPIVRHEERVSAGNTTPYSVLGETYTVLSDAAGYVSEGYASWYGTKFHGRKTANGERYDMYALTAAHRRLPIPSYVRVTNLDNGRNTIVRVNDRGPFHEDRVIDLSYAAAVKLDFEKAGTARVRLEVIEPKAKIIATPAPPSITARYFVQTRALKNFDSADAVTRVFSRISDATPSVVRVADEGRYRVRAGPMVNRSQAERLLVLAVMHDIPTPEVIEE